MDNLPKVDSKPVTPLETSSDVPAAHAGHPDTPAAHAGHPDVPADVREVPIETFNTPLEVAPVSPLPTEEAEEVVYEGQILAPENYSKVSTTATEAAPRRGNKFLKWLGLGAAGVGITTAAVFGAKAVSDNGTSNEPPVNDPKATNQPEATATPDDGVGTEKPPVSSVDLDPSKIPNNVIEYNLFETLTNEQKNELRMMEGESLEAFRSRPYEEQMAFAKYVYDNNIAVLKYRLDATGQTHVYKDANTETPEGIKQYNDLKLLLLSSLKTMSSDGAIAFDTDTALKASVMINHASEASIKYYDDAIKSWNLNTAPVTSGFTIQSSKVLENGDIIVNEHYPDAPPSQTTYTRVFFKDITGADTSDVVQRLSVNEQDPRFDPSIQ